MNVQPRKFVVQRPLPAPVAQSPIVSRPKPPVTPSAPPAVVQRTKADPAYDAAVSRIKGLIAAEATLPLQKGSESRLYAHPERPAKGTLVMYHGYTAGSWQFELLAKQAYDDGYNVYIPRLPGHGFKDAKGVEDPSHLLTAKNWRDYETFGDSTFADAKGLGSPISTLGLSVGANIAIDVAERHPEVKRVVAYAPFIRPRTAGWIIDVVRVLDKVSFGMAGRALSLVPWGWGKECEADTASGKRPGHSKFNLGTIYAACQLGQKITQESVKHLQAPVQYFTTGVDDAADEAAIRKVHDLAGGDPRNGWYHYPISEGVPHPMVHPMEDKGHGQCPELYRKTLSFLDTGVPLDRNEGP